MTVRRRKRVLMVTMLTNLVPIINTLNMTAILRVTYVQWNFRVLSLLNNMLLHMPNNLFAHLKDADVRTKFGPDLRCI